MAIICIMIHIVFAFLGFLAGGFINVLADKLPQRDKVQPLWPYCPQCDHRYGVAGWWVLGRLLTGVGRCPTCDLPLRWRLWLVEWGTAVFFALLPLWIANTVNLLVNAVYIAVLILVTVIDLEHRKIFDVVTFPMTGLALIGSLIVKDNNLSWALAGSVAGFAITYIMYWFGQLVFGPGAFGQGDVKLGLMMGAMLGIHRIVIALIIGMLIGGVISFILIVGRFVNRRSFLPYGQYLALAGIMVLVWGREIINWYLR